VSGMTPDGEWARIETSDIKTVLRVLKNQVAKLDDIQLKTNLKGREQSAELAKAQRDLLYVAHLFDKGRLLVMDEYHAIRGRTAHLLEE
jgi:hypothetical protein